MKCDGRHARVGCVHHRRAHTVDAMRTEIQRGSNIHLVRRRMTGTIRNILVSDDNELTGRNFLIVAPANDGHSDVSVIHVTTDNINIVRGMATNSNLDIYELIATEE